jgi:hypothetical protein
MSDRLDDRVHRPQSGSLEPPESEAVLRRAVAGGEKT